MKRLFIIQILMIIAISVQSQITFDASYTLNTFKTTMSLNKFHISGYKYVKKDVINLKIYLYNINHTLYKTINIPAQTVPIDKVEYISENLFDNDPLIEYCLTTFTSTPFTRQFMIYKETGAQMMYKDSATLGGTSGFYFNAFNIQEPVFFDGINAKIRLSFYGQTGFAVRDEIYTLPGTIPCVTCTSGLITGFNVDKGNTTIEDPEFFPNPVSDQLKLKYKLPEGTHLAEMKIYNTEGKLVDEFKVTDDFDFIYLPTNYNNGLYLYSLIVDGKVVKTEKIVLNK